MARLQPKGKTAQEERLFFSLAFSISSLLPRLAPAIG
jgi:hypothetical protein